MTYKKIVSLSIALSFIVLLVTGVLSYVKDYTHTIASLHTVFGIVFSLGIIFHFINNFKPLKNYSKGGLIFIIFSVIALIFSGAYFQLFPFNTLMDFGAKLKAGDSKEINDSKYEIVEMDLNNHTQLHIDLLRSEHYWHPQMAVWVEDDKGNYVETLFVSKATAKGLFFGGRSKDNFKEFDQNKQGTGDYRRVNALPVWSHKRAVQYDDGMYVPSKETPLADGITGATLIDNFKLLTSIDSMHIFHLKIELNVAFDDNEFYSEYDFPNDEVYHNGTGQLGQPSIIYETIIQMGDGKEYYLMDLVGHGHHSAKDGNIYTDLSRLTTAKQIVERIVVGVKQSS